MLLSQALHRLETVAAARPDWGPVHDEKAYVLSRLDRFDEAFLAAQRAEQCDPTNAKFIAKRLAMQIHELAKSGHGAMGEPAAGSQLLQEAENLIAQHPEYPNGMFLKAELLAALGRPQSGWEECLALGAESMGNRTRMATGYAATLIRLMGTLRDSSVLCYALADRAGTA